MAKSVLLKRDKYILQKKRKKKLAYRAIAVIVCISPCFGTAAVIKKGTPLSALYKTESTLNEALYGGTKNT